MPTDRQRVWGQRGDYVVSAVPEEPEFDKVVKKLGLTKSQWLDSKELKRWIRQNYMSRYVPESLLEALGLEWSTGR